MAASRMMFSLSSISPTYLSIANTSTPPPYLLQLGVKYKSNISKQRLRIRRGISVPRAGPSSSSYIFAFIFPLSLLAVTIFASIRVADKLDQKFLEEVAVNPGILDETDADGNGVIPTEEERVPPRTRNRPKREVESSSM